MIGKVFALSVIALVSLNAVLCEERSDRCPTTPPAPENARRKRHLPVSVGGLVNGVKGNIGKGLNTIGEDVQSSGKFISDMGSKVSGENNNGQSGGNNGQSSDEIQIQKVLNKTYSSLSSLRSDVKTGPSTQLEDKLNAFNEDISNAEEVGDKAKAGLWKATDQAYATEGEQGKQMQQQMKQAKEGAKQNWNNLIKALEEADQEVQQKMQSASEQDKTRLSKVSDDYNKWIDVLKGELKDAMVCGLGTPVY